MLNAKLMPSSKEGIRQNMGILLEKRLLHLENVALQKLLRIFWILYNIIEGHCFQFFMQ